LGAKCRSVGRRTKNKHAGHSVNNNDETVTRPNITAITELLSNFDGRNDIYKTWERQILFFLSNNIFLRNAYKLLNDLMKIMLGLRFKRKASEWLHSKPEYIAMRVDDLLKKLKEMFYRQFNKIVTKRLEEIEQYGSEMNHSVLIITIK